MRTIHLDVDTVTMFARQIELFGLGTDGLVFHNGNGHWKHRDAAEYFNKAATKADTKATWHTLRHHYASVLIGGGCDVVTVADQMGNSPAVCLKTYSHMFPNKADKVRATVAEAWTTEPAVYSLSTP